jgi:hypothetical protein
MPSTFASELACDSCEFAHYIVSVTSLRRDRLHIRHHRDHDLLGDPSMSDARSRGAPVLLLRALADSITNATDRRAIASGEELKRLTAQHIDQVRRLASVHEAKTSGAR